MKMLTFGLVSFGVLAASAFQLDMGMNGDVALGESGARIGMRVFAKNWQGTCAGLSDGVDGDHPAGRGPDVRTGTALLTLTDKEGTFARGRVSLLRGVGDFACLSADLTALADRETEGVVMTFELGCREMAGLEWTLSNGCKGVFPAKFGPMRVFGEKVTGFTYVDPTTKKPVAFSFPEPTFVMLQDNRLWNPTFSIRISPVSLKHDFRKGEQRSFFMTISHPEGVKIDYERPVTVSAGKDWIVLDYHKDILAGSALDFSGMGLNDAPAGKYGWLKAVGDRFEFENLPGRAQRFYGVNFCFDANVPDHKLAEQVVLRLKRLGYNTIRIHHYERPLTAGMKSSVELNPKAMDRFDKLCALAVEHGLYLTTDVYVSRSVKWREIGFDREGEVPMNVMKSLIALHEPAFDNWKAFAKAFFLHKNPYTGRRYVDEPGFPLISFVNENTMDWTWNEIRDLPVCREAWRDWLRAKRAKDPSFAKGQSEDSTKVSGGSNAAFQCFAADVEAKSSLRQREFLKSLGSRALFTGQNCADNQAMASARETYDYVDTHFYVDHPEFLGRSWQLPSKCGNSNPVQATSLSPVSVAYTRLAEKPFTITEWNFSGPGMFRGVGGIMTGALASLQEWDGLWRFAYSHSDRGMRDGGGFPGYFDMAGDPLGQASDRACICLYLRGDLGALADRIALGVGPAECPADGRPAPNRPDWQNEAWNVQVARTTRSEAAGFRTYPLRDVKARLPFVPQGCAALKLDRERGALTIDTPLTAGGFAPAGALEAGPVRFDVGDVAATVWASSLDGKAIAESRRLLVSHLTDAQANGNVYADRAKKILLKWGNGVVVRNGKATVALALKEPAAYEVWGLETSGRRLERLPTEVRDGRLVFTADVNAKGGARMLYEVVAKQ